MDTQIVQLLFIQRFLGFTLETGEGFQRAASATVRGAHVDRPSIQPLASTDAPTSIAPAIILTVLRRCLNRSILDRTPRR